MLAVHNVSSSNFTLNDGMVVNREPVILFPFSIGKAQVPFVYWHIGRVQLAQTSCRPRVDHMAVHAWFNVAACLVIVASNTVLFAPHV